MANGLKQALSIPEQLKFIKNIPISIDNEQEAKKFLLNISLCHLKTYWLSVAEPNKEFGELIKLYEFDRRLKLLMLDAIERIEISVRAMWIYALTDKGKNYNALTYDDSKIYQNSFNELQQSLKKARDKNGSHLPQMRKYCGSNTMPPIWKMAEIISLGLLSRLIEALADKNPIGRRYNLDGYNLSEILHSITKIRNICAHHDILWDYADGKFPKLYKSPKAAILRKSLAPDAPKMSLYAVACFCAFLLTQIIDGTAKRKWVEAFKKLIDGAPPYASSGAMGFPVRWQNLPLWR